MTDYIEPLPEELAEEIDCLFAALQQAKALLSVGRAYGLCVGLSPRLAAEIAKRHIEGAALVSKTWQVDPRKRISDA